MPMSRFPSTSAQCPALRSSPRCPAAGESSNQAGSAGSATASARCSGSPVGTDVRIVRPVTESNACLARHALGSLSNRERSSSFCRAPGPSVRRDSAGLSGPARAVDPLRCGTARFRQPRARQHQQLLSPQTLEADSMSQSEQQKQQQKIIQYLGEAHSTEMALTRVLQSQIAMTPRGSYRSALESHLDETRDHAERVQARLQELGESSGNPLTAGLGFVGGVLGQAVAFGKTPFDLLRGSGGEEKVLKNAKDASASEALEIATYTAVARLADRAGDQPTAKLAASILADEQKMLERVLREIPKLTDAVFGAEVKGNGSYDITTSGAGETVREAGAATKQAARKTSAATKRTARQARKAPGVAQAEGQLKGAVASESDLAIARYDSLTADEITSRLSELSQIDLAKVDSYERKNQNRTTVLSRITSLRGDEPWPGYAELTAAEVQPVLSEGDADRARQVHSYERAHKNRIGIVKAAEREHTNA